MTFLDYSCLHHLLTWWQQCDVYLGINPQYLRNFSLYRTLQCASSAMQTTSSTLYLSFALYAVSNELEIKFKASVIVQVFLDLDPGSPGWSLELMISLICLIRWKTRPKIMQWTPPGAKDHRMSLHSAPEIRHDFLAWLFSNIHEKQHVF